jgi:hypothetical protein
MPPDDPPRSFADHDLIVRMDTKLDIALGRIDDHERRMRQLEAKVYMFAGLAAAAGTGGGFGLDRLIGGT